MKTLDSLLELEPKIIYPGHGPVIDDACATIRYYIQHRMKREAQIVQFLKDNADKEHTAMDIVKTVYKVRINHFMGHFLIELYLSVDDCLIASGCNPHCNSLSNGLYHDCVCVCVSKLVGRKRTYYLCLHTLFLSFFFFIEFQFFY